MLDIGDGVEIKGSYVGFYGSDGVCLFKYFVKSGDSQQNFVWVILFINFSCFMLIMACYSAFYFLSSRWDVVKPFFDIIFCSAYVH